MLDSQTKAPAKRNIFYNSQPSDLIFADSAIEKLQARGLHMVACGVALSVIASMAGEKVDVSAPDAQAEFMNSLLPGVSVVPSGVFAVSHAQEKSCTYCYAE